MLVRQFITTRVTDFKVVALNKVSNRSRTGTRVSNFKVPGTYAVLFTYLYATKLRHVS